MRDTYNPFRLPLKNRWLARTIERLLGLTRLAKCYDQRPDLRADQPGGRSEPFLKYTLSALGINVNVEGEENLLQIPKQGPVIFIANHPLGGLEGVAMSEALIKVRPDLKVLTNLLLTKIPELSDIFIGVDVLSKDARKENAKGVRAACKHLSSGGALLIYPAGKVSAIDTKDWKIKDIEWNILVGRLVNRYKAVCMPFYVLGKNSRLFYILGLIHKRLRTVMLARELSNKQGKTLTIRAGSPILYDEVEPLEDDQAVTNYLRVATDLIGVNERSSARDAISTNDSQENYVAIQSGVSQAQLITDVQSLDAYKLLSQRNFSVYCAPYNALGSIMQEIAKEREVTFRAAGEGTGKAFDSDQFDPHYLHLFVWDDERNQIVGGYRLGRTDEIVKAKGIKALYSRSLYQFDQDYLERMGKTLEMGRSFVAIDYQRHPRALDMLWKGIGTYVANNPEYHTLFGCVSISSEHSPLAQAFISDSMMESFRAEQKYLNEVKPFAPLKVQGKIWNARVLASLGKIVVINKLLGRCDPGSSIPVLLRQYLALNGRLVCFTVNKGFNESLDGLILVDLRKTPEKYLQRYLGKEGSKKFLEKWAVIDEAVA